MAISLRLATSNLRIKNPSWTRSPCRKSCGKDQLQKASHADCDFVAPDVTVRPAKGRIVRKEHGFSSSERHSPALRNARRKKNEPEGSHRLRFVEKKF